MYRLILVAIFFLPAGSAQNWPSFRGPGASGVADGQKLPSAWDVAKGINIAWKTPIPGLAHSSPIVWGDRVFVTTAISSRGNADFKRGLYGEGDASEDRSPQQWKLLCLNKKSGAVLWERLAYEGAPKEKRHMKATYANATPATDGEVVVAFFGSQGIYAYDLDGKPLWNRDLGRFDVGAYDLPEYEWGTASSPILYRGMVIVQCDQQKGSFLTALDRKTGQTVWKTERDELPSWGTPTIVPGKQRTELVTNASNFIRGYDPATGKELWRLGGSSKITAPTPIYNGDLILVASGRRPEAPIFAIRAGAEGDISLPNNHSDSRSVAWSKTQRGSYMPTPLFYHGLLYVLANAGILDCYGFETGREIYRERIPHQGSGFSASPVASDGKIYLSSEDGDIFVVSAGEQFSLMKKNSMEEPVMATPAISGGMLIVRTQHQLFAIRQK
ncbi:MAG TPA: PQQ-binding-like beta-propeller repeat protein [Bryobacteraceae bacterium]|nr:PQQ-binding-like beta-propeller repeat protein [Bryobacteraceae bacterium]